MFLQSIKISGWKEIGSQSCQRDISDFFEIGRLTKTLPGLFSISVWTSISCYWLMITMKVTTMPTFPFWKTFRNSVDDSVRNWHHLTIFCIGNQFQCNFISKYDRIISNSFVQICSSLKFEYLSLTLFEAGGAFSAPPKGKHP